MPTCSSMNVSRKSWRAERHWRTQLQQVTATHSLPSSTPTSLRSSQVWSSTISVQVQSRASLPPTWLVSFAHSSQLFGWLVSFTNTSSIATSGKTSPSLQRSLRTWCRVRATSSWVLTRSHTPSSVLSFLQVSSASQFVASAAPSTSQVVATSRLSLHSQ